MEKLINDKIKELTDNGKLDEIVTKQVTNFINGIVSDSLSTWSDANKKFKEKLNSKLIEDFEKLDFVSFSKTLTDLVEVELNKSIVEFGIAPAKEMIKNFVGSLEKKEWKLSEIIEKYKEEEVIPDEHGESGEIRFIHEVSDYGTIYIGFDEDTKSNTHRYQCKYQLMINKKDKRLYSPTIDGTDLHPLNKIGLYGFDLFLFKLYATGCTVEDDYQDVETEWSTYND
jgi:hypothetical protein